MNSNEKGGEFERLMAGHLSRWLTRGTQSRALWRTPGSGAMAGRLSPAQQRWVGGDLGVLDKECGIACSFIELFHIELKHYKQLDWHTMVYTEDSGFLWQTWKKAVRQAGPSNRLPLVIVKQNFQPPVAMAPPEFWVTLPLRFVLFYEEVGTAPLKNLLSFSPNEVIEAARKLRYGPQAYRIIPRRPSLA